MGVLDDAIREHLALRRRHGASESELERQEKEALGPARREPSSREAASAPAEPPAPDVAAPALADRPSGGDSLVDEAPSDEAQAHEHFEEYGAEPLDASEEATRISAPGALDDGRILDEEELAEEELADELAGREGDVEVAEELTAPSLSDPSEVESPTEEHATVFSSAPAASPVGGDEDALEVEEEEPLLEDEEPLPADERALDEEVMLAEDDELLEEEAEPAAVDPFDEGLPADAADVDEDDDVLEDTPDFLQETPEHERLWFEQKPPRDFDLDR